MSEGETKVRPMSDNFKRFIFLGLVMSAMPTAALAYIGPGVCAGALAAVLGVIGSIFLAIFALLYYPIKRLLKGRKGKTARSASTGKPAE